MDIKELRIGNAVMCQCRGEYKPHTIKSIWYNDEEKLYFVELDNGFQCNLGGVSPIPITDELLLKIGFKKGWNGYFAYREHNDELSIRFCENYTYIEYANLCFNPEDVTETNYCSSLEFPNTLHLHTLQNIWHLLTGKELEIKL